MGSQPYTKGVTGSLMLPLQTEGAGGAGRGGLGVPRSQVLNFAVAPFLDEDLGLSVRPQGRRAGDQEPRSAPPAVTACIQQG